MRILLLAGSDLKGGAHRSAFRLHRALRKSGADSHLLVGQKCSDDEFTREFTPKELGFPPRMRGFLDKVPNFLLNRPHELISLGVLGVDIRSIIETMRADILHLHWVNDGMIRAESLKSLSVPVIWTFHDMWPFTGGCHYSENCEMYQAACRKCPKIAMPGVDRVTSWVHARKQSYWTDHPRLAVAPSRWIGDKARESSLFSTAEIRQIPYCIDASVFHARNEKSIRADLGLADNHAVVLFICANQERKGAGLISEIITTIEQNTNRECRFLFAGGVPPGLCVSGKMVILPPTNGEHLMADYYAASDVFVIPSFEDNLPNAVIESLACGTPVVGFPTGGIPEMIQPHINGAISSDHTPKSIAAATAHLLNDAQLDRAKISADAHATYAESVVADAHIALYRSAISRVHRSNR